MKKLTVDYYGARCFQRSYRWAWVDADFVPNGKGAGSYFLALGRERGKYRRPWCIGVDWDAFFGEPNRLYINTPWSHGWINLPEHRQYVDAGEYHGTPAVTLERCNWRIERPILRWRANDK